MDKNASLFGYPVGNFRLYIARIGTVSESMGRIQYDNLLVKGFFPEKKKMCRMEQEVLLPVLLPAPAEFNGAGIYLIQDIRQDFFLFAGRWVAGILQGCLDLPYNVADIGHVFNPSFILREHGE
jgi:hypothetical protein